MIRVCPFVRQGIKLCEIHPYNFIGDSGRTDPLLMLNSPFCIIYAETEACQGTESGRDSGRERIRMKRLPAVILEFKVYDARKGERTLEDTAQNALKQIEEKRYATELLSRGIPPEGILIYGLAFRNKECLIRKGNNSQI
jgi:hypothetical protein